MSDEALQIAEKRRDSKSRGEKERYTFLNAEFQRIARKDKSAFLSDQCKEIEQNNRMGKTRDLFKKIRATGRSQDGRGIGRGDHFLPYKFIERTIERRANFTKKLLITS